MPDIGSTFGGALPSSTGSFETPEQLARNNQAYIDSMNVAANRPTVGLGEIMNYGMAEGSKLLTEGWTKVTDTLGSLNPFKKAAVSVPLAPGTGTKQALATAGAIKGSTQTVDASDDSTSHKVKLVASELDSIDATFANTVNFVADPLAYRQIEFDIMPDVQEQRSAEYEPISTPQMPTEFQKYKGTKAVTWQITGVFACRTRDEARRNLMYINNLRAWSMPYFGHKQSNDDKLGAPPPVLKFSGWRGLVGEVPVVMTTANWQWPKDCDWIPTGVFDEDGKEIPFPTILQVNISIIESYSPEQVNGFDLFAFRNGRMVNAWLAPDDQPHTYFVSQPMHDNGGNQSVVNGTAQPQADGSGVVKKPASSDLLSKAKGALAAGMGALTSGKGLMAGATAALGTIAGESGAINSAIAGAAAQVQSYMPGGNATAPAAIPNVNASGEAPSEAASTPAVQAQAAPIPAAQVTAQLQQINNSIQDEQNILSSANDAAASLSEFVNDTRLKAFAAQQSGDSTAVAAAQATLASLAQKQASVQSTITASSAKISTLQAQKAALG